MPGRLRVVVRADLSPGQQAVQGVHAQVAFAKAHPEVEHEWFDSSNTLALLCVQDEEALCRVLDQAEMRGIRAAVFREPDIGDRMTAICLEPGDAARRLCRGLTPALQSQ